MSRRLLAASLLAASVIALSACTSTTAGPAATSTPAPTASPTPTPTAEAHLVVAVDGLSLVDADDTTSAGFDDAAALLDLLEQATGMSPTPTAVENPPGYEMNLVNYDWEGLILVSDESGTGVASIVVTSQTVNGTPIATADGFAVGSPREALTAAGAKDVFDADGDGIADELSLDWKEVPGTNSLVTPGQVGSEYLMFSITDDVVTRIHAPANDFSDL